MFTQIFLQVCRMSYTASYVILFILLARVVLRKAPKSLSYMLWGAALFRLACPWSFKSALSLPAIGDGNSATGMVPSLIGPQTAQQAISNGYSTAAGAAAPSGELVMGTVTASGDELEHGFTSLLQNPWVCLWLVGVGLLLIYSAASLLRLRQQLKDAVCVEDNIYASERVSSPFVIGVIRPKIYLPELLSESEKQYVLLHEQVHIRRFDHVTRFAGFLVCCVHWFNPLVWAAFFLSGKDMEMSCDEAVVRTLGSSVKKEYTTFILSFSTGRRMAGGALLAFSQGDVKGRIQNVLKYKKRSVFAMSLGVVIVAAVSILLIADPRSQAEGVEAGGLNFERQPVPEGTCYYSTLQSTNLREDMLSERMGFPVHFPGQLDGERYIFNHASEGFGTGRTATPQTWQELVPDLRKAVEDQTVFDLLREYEPYPKTAVVYREPEDRESMFIISIAAADSPKPWDGEVLAQTETKVGSDSAWWVEIEYPIYDELHEGIGDWILEPDGVEPSFMLIWIAKGVRYDLLPVGLRSKAEMTVEDAVTIAESYMSKQ